MAKRVLLVVNTRARRGRDARALAKSALERHGHTVVIGETRRPSDLAKTIAQHGNDIDLVMIGGGDGTLIAAIAGLRAAKKPLVILPLGTINELGRALAIPFDVAAACALVDEGRSRAIDIGCVDGFWFFNEASIGLSTYVAQLQTGEVKSRWGMLAIPIATLRALRHLRPFHLDVEIDGVAQTFRTVQLTVANNYRFGGVVENVDGSIDDGFLDVYSIDIRQWLDVFRIIVAVARKRFPQASNVQTFRAKRVRVRGRHRHSVFADGERASRTPAEFTIVHQAIDVMVPR